MTLVMVVFALAACDGSVAQDAPQHAPPSPPNPAANAAPRGSRRMITANVLAIGADRVVALAPEGEEAFFLAPGALAGHPPTRGDTVTLDCAHDPLGALVVEQVLPHTGLPIRYGTVTAASTDRLTVTSPLGEQTFVVNAWSDLPDLLAVGQFVGVKHYGMNDERTILNAKRFPGVVEDTGVVVAWEGASVSVQTLGGSVAHTLDPATLQTLPDGFGVGSTATIRSRRNGPKRTVASVAVRTDELVFVGKMSSWDAATHTFAMVDAWGGVLGIVRFRWDAGCGGDCAVVPGDLAEVRYRFAQDGTPTIAALTKRELSPVYFGEITEIDATHVRMVTLQNQTKLLTVTPQTRLPVPIRVGDRADVIYVPGATADARVAVAIVKE